MSPQNRTKPASPREASRRVIRFGQSMPFRDVVGHRRLLTLLSRAIARDSLTPSLILSGPEGVGKRLTALAVAQALNCVPEGGSSPTAPIRDWAPIRRMRRMRGVPPHRARRASDVQTIEPGETGSIKIEQVRAAIDACGVSPVRRTPTRDDYRARRTRLLSRRRTRCSKRSKSRFPHRCSFSSRRGPTCCCRRCVRVARICVSGRLNVADVAVVLERSHGYSRPDALTRGRRVGWKRAARARAAGRGICRGQKRGGGSVARQRARPANASRPGEGIC